jgi:hypothetical protein
MTGIYYSVMTNNLEITELLLKNNCDINNIMDKKNNNLLMISV